MLFFFRFRAGAACRSALRVLLLYVDGEDCAAGAAGVHFAYYFCAYKLRSSSRSCGSALRVLYFST